MGLAYDGNATGSWSRAAAEEGRVTLLDNRLRFLWRSTEHVSDVLVQDNVGYIVPIPGVC